MWSKPYTHALDRMYVIIIYRPYWFMAPRATVRRLHRRHCRRRRRRRFICRSCYYISIPTRRVCSIASGGCKNTKRWFGTYPPTTAYIIERYYCCYYYNNIIYGSPKSYKRRRRRARKISWRSPQQWWCFFFRFPFSYSVLIALSLLLLMQSYVIY